MDVLEIALSLHRAPGERFRLRERPLPPGLVHVMEVAAAAPQALQAAAEELREQPAVVLEAARFYLEQVLFATPDADAYRVLGGTPEASQDTLRLHHRWLQRWLHPDRAQAGDAAVFATRVNQAWSQLRTPELRHAYDVQRAESQLAGAPPPLPAATLREWDYAEPVARHGGRSRWLAAAALASCLVLAVLVMRHEDPDPAADQYAQQATSVDPVAAEASDADALSRAFARIPSASIPHRPVERRPVAPATAPRVVVAHRQPPVTMQPPSAPLALARPLLRAPAPPKPTPVVAVRAAVAPSPPPAPDPVSVAPVVVAAATAAPGARLDVDSSLLLQRMHLAEGRLTQVTAYMAADPGAAPLWNDIQTQLAAERARNRIAPGNGGRFEFASPRWELQRDNAKIKVDYRCRDCGIREGRLDVKLVWREGMWLVSGIDLAPSA
jgi:hypothetical protein